MTIHMHEWPQNQANLHASKQIIFVYFLGLWTEQYLNL